MTGQALSIRELPREAIGDRGEPMLALFDELASQVGGAMTLAYRGQERWVDGVRAALLELLTFMDANPVFARFLFVGSRVGSVEMLTRRGRALDVLVRALEADSPSATTVAAAPAPFGAEAIVGAVVSVLHARIAQRPEAPLLKLCGPLMGVIVMPYLGTDAAREELLRATSVHESEGWIAQGAQ